MWKDLYTINNAVNKAFWLQSAKIKTIPKLITANMAKKRTKTKTITLKSDSGTFNYIFGRFSGSKNPEKTPKNHDITMLRSMLSHEKARLLHTLKAKQPNSIYELAKLLGRDFKSVRQDIRLLEELGFVEMIPIHKGNRHKLKPLIVLDELKINIEI